MTEFQFKYMTNSNTIRFDDFNVYVQIGPFVKRNFPVQNLIFFRYTQEKTYHQMFMVYTDEKGKRKKTVLTATPGEPGIMNLNYFMMEKFPQKCLNNLSDKEAFKTMQVANPKKMAMWIVIIMMNLLIGIGLFPALRHYFDFGFEKMTIDELIAGKDVGTRNIWLSGRLLDKGIEETTTTTRRGSTTTSHSTFIPVVPDNREDDQPIKVLLEFKELSDEEYGAVRDFHEFKGVIRDIWWEGVSSKQIGYFKENYGIEFPEEPILVEYTGEEHNDAYAIYVFGGMEVVFLIILLIVWIRMKK